MPAAPLYPDTFSVRPTKTIRRRKNPRTVTMPKHVGPHVRLVFAEMSRLHFTYDEVEERSGVGKPTIKQWRSKNRPSLESLEAVLATLGFGFLPVATLEALPSERAGDLVTLAKNLERDIPQTWAALIDIGVQQKLLRMRADERAAVLADHDARKARVANDNKPYQLATVAAT